MDTGVKNKSTGLIFGVAVAALAVGVFGADVIKRWFMPVSAEAVGLLSIREVNRLEVLQARFAGVVTTPTCTTVAMLCVPGTQKTSILIASGDVGYFVDMAGMSERNFSWDKATSTLTVTLPSPTVSKPNIDLRQVRTYTDGTIFTWDSMSEVGRRENENKIYNDILKQANDKMMLDRARSSATRAVGGLLGYALKESGFDEASVKVTFVR